MTEITGHTLKINEEDKKETGSPERDLLDASRNLYKLIKEQEEDEKTLSALENRLNELLRQKIELEEKIEKAVENIEEEITENNDALAKKELEKIPSEKSGLREKFFKHIRYPVMILMAVLYSYFESPEYREMFENYKERHWEKIDADDPSIRGINNDIIFVEKTTYDYLGEQKINYKTGYYMTSVFDLTDRTPPRFKLLNDRDFRAKIDSAAGITTNLFKKFQKFSEFVPELKGHTGNGAEQKADIPVIGYNLKNNTIRAGHYGEFNDSWVLSETYEIPLNFNQNADSTINLAYHDQAMRMVPLTTDESGRQIPFPIGITHDKGIKKIKPEECTRFGTLDGGKVIMVCGEKQLQVNGSFSDIFHVFEQLKKDNKGKKVQAFLLDNGAYNVPIWDKDNTLTPQEIKSHFLRHYDGGTALILMNDGRISPYEYKNKYKEIEHYTLNFTLDTLTHDKPAVNEKSVIVLHHTGNYDDPNQIIREFMDTTKGVSSHVLILKDGTRHLFNTDDYVLAHAGKSDFNDKNKVNFFSLGVEIEGDSQDGQFTLAQLESLLEYLRPRIQKYHIPLENITTHKIIRDNYIRKHPDEKVLTKRDLSEKVWKQIKEIIEKKLYEKKDVAIDNTAAKLIGALAFQEGYRLKGDLGYAINKADEILNSKGVSKESITDINNWLKSIV